MAFWIAFAVVGTAAGVGGMIANGVVQDQNTKKAIKASEEASLAQSLAKNINAKLSYPNAIVIR